MAVLVFVLFCLYLATGPFGRIRLGPANSTPDYSFFTWIGMLFSAGFGVGLVFWGIAEPMSHFLHSPTGDITPLPPDAARAAMEFAFFNRGTANGRSLSWLDWLPITASIDKTQIH